MADPVLELYGPSGLITANDNWRDNARQAAAIEATGVPPTNKLEAAIVASLAPASYTAVVRGKNDGTGVGLVEVYDLNQAADSVLANISTRGFVESGDNAMIGGFILGGSSGGSRLIIRALGPSLPVAGKLINPTLELYDGNGLKVNSNDNWKVNESSGQSQEAAVRATTIPPTKNLESAIVTTLPAGFYTAIVRGKGGGTGAGLVEVYNLR